MSDSPIFSSPGSEGLGNADLTRQLFSRNEVSSEYLQLANTINQLNVTGFSLAQPTLVGDGSKVIVFVGELHSEYLTTHAAVKQIADAIKPDFIGCEGFYSEVGHERNFRNRKGLIESDVIYKDSRIDSMLKGIQQRDVLVLDHQKKYLTLATTCTMPVLGIEAMEVSDAIFSFLVAELHTPLGVVVNGLNKSKSAREAFTSLTTNRNLLSQLHMYSEKLRQYDLEFPRLNYDKISDCLTQLTYANAKQASEQVVEFAQAVFSFIYSKWFPRRNQNSIQTLDELAAQRGAKTVVVTFGDGHLAGVGVTAGTTLRDYAAALGYSSFYFIPTSQNAQAARQIILTGSNNIS